MKAIKVIALAIILSSSTFLTTSFAAETNSSPTAPAHKTTDDNTLIVTTILSDKKGNSYFGEHKRALKKQGSANSAYDLGSMSEPFPMGSIVYRESKVNKEKAGWHIAPTKQGRIIIYMSGKYRITVGSPMEPVSRVFGAGDVLYFYDTTGVGHVTEVLEEGAALMYDLSEPLPL